MTKTVNLVVVFLIGKILVSSSKLRSMNVKKKGGETNGVGGRAKKKKNKTKENRNKREHKYVRGKKKERKRKIRGTKFVFKTRRQMMKF